MMHEVGPEKKGRTERHTIAWVANFLISLIALGALFLNWMPCTYFEHKSNQSSAQCLVGPFMNFIKLILGIYVVVFIFSTYSLVKVDCVFASDNVADGRSAWLLARLGGLACHC